MLGGGGCVYLVVRPPTARVSLDDGYLYVRIPLDEVRLTTMGWDDGDIAIEVETAIGKRRIKRFLPANGSTPNREEYRRLVNDSDHRRLGLVTLSQIFDDLTIHEVDCDITWTWNHELVIWERALGRPTRHAPT